MTADGPKRRFPLLVMAYRNLSRTKFRTVLAALGIVIGVTAVGSIGVLGTTLQQSVTRTTGDIANEVVVSPTRAAEGAAINERQLRAIERVARDADVIPIELGIARTDLGRETPRTQLLLGIDETGKVLEATTGRVPATLRGGVLVGSRVAAGSARRPGPGSSGETIEPGDRIEVGPESYRVRGIVRQGERAFSFPLASLSVVVPSDLVEGNDYWRVVVLTADARAAEETAAELREELNDRRKQVTVRSRAETAEALSDVFGAIRTFLAGIASVALLVAGVSILTVMLMSTVERREEIGLLRAVGFGKRDVSKILLAEALFLGVLGAVVGALLSIGTGMIASVILLGAPLEGLTATSLGYIALAFGFGALTSVVSGVYPAWKAANERPVDALQG